MARYIQIEFRDILTEQSDLLLAQLSMVGFEGFEEEENIFKAFIPYDQFDEAAVLAIVADHHLSFHQSVIEETNWNAVWESNFKPVIIDDFVAIRAHFHEPIAGVAHELVITPKMSFGTGHHATTLMMIRHMRLIGFAGKRVLDFGTGTGILSILAEKLGAAAITAIDNDEWSITNAMENLERNACIKTMVEIADQATGDRSFDIILANINKNVILDNLDSLTKQLAPRGLLVLSGLLAPDEHEILDKTEKLSLKPGNKLQDNNWISLTFSH